MSDLSTSRHRHQQVYDPRLRRLVFETGDVSIAAEHGVPRSTAAGWLRHEPPPVVSLGVLDMSYPQLQFQSQDPPGLARGGPSRGRDQRSGAA